VWKLIILLLYSTTMPACVGGGEGNYASDLARVCAAQIVTSV